jgi:hypothetical protein
VPHWGRPNTGSGLIGGKVTKMRKPPRKRRADKESGRRRVNQESVDEMATLRRQGLTFKDIGLRIGCSERTARRYASKVEPQIQLPGTAEQAVHKEAGVLRDELSRWLSETLYHFKGFPQPRLSVRFMAEANRLMHDRLAAMDQLTLELVARDGEMKLRLLREVTGPLYQDYRSHIRWDTTLGQLDESTSATGWRPPSEREMIDDPEGDDMTGEGGEF